MTERNYIQSVQSGNLKKIKIEIMRIDFWRYNIVFNFIFKNFKKASKYADYYNKYLTNPFLKHENSPDYNKSIYEKTYIWVEKMKDDS